MASRGQLGRILLIVAGLWTSGSAFGQRIYWTDEGSDTVESADLDGSNRQVLVSAGQLAPHGVALHLPGGKLYWVDSAANSIRRADLDGTNVETLVVGLSSPEGLSIDRFNGKMYWTAFARIQRANLDGTSVETIVMGNGLIAPIGIEVDPAAGKVYWTEIFAPGLVQRSNLDGTNIETLISGLSIPRGIALDRPAGKMYLTLSGDGRLLRANLDGSSVEEVLLGLGTPRGLSIDLGAGKIYWTNPSAFVDRIQRSNTDGTDLEDIVSTGLQSPQGIVVDGGCGNGVVTQGLEECDDGNQTNGDGCDVNCTFTACGNGVISAGEICDDGNVTDDDGCDSNCTPTSCGNGVVTGIEQCDDGNTVSVDGCSAMCILEPFLFVDQNATGALNDGSSWCEAFLDLSSAIAAVTTETSILIADGTYVPDATGLGDARDATFQLPSGVTVEGGYAGCGQPGPHVSDRTANPVILSGDLNGDDGPAFANNGENAYHVVSGNGTAASTTITSVSITGGNADTAPDNNGGGILVSGGSVTIDGCEVRGNSAQNGGGIAVLNGGTPTVVNSLVTGNAASSLGGGIADNSGAGLSLINSTVTDNSATLAGGGVRVGFSGTNTVVVSSVLWGNTDSGGAPETAQISIFVGASAAVDYSTVEGLSALGGTGNLGTDPLFIDAAGGDYRIGSTSPCIDAGDSTAVPAGADVDLDHRPRLVDDPMTADTGVGPAPIVDMGAYEIQECLGVAECCDTVVPDGIRDDVCTWCACSGNCVEIVTADPSDIGGPFNTCEPDGFCNSSDVNLILLCFSTVAPCDTLNIDAGREFGMCAPDGFCNVFDANHALSCFAKVNPCNCAGGPAPITAPTVVGEADLHVKAERSEMSSGETVAVRVYLAGNTKYLQSFQLETLVTGGRRGRLELMEILIEPSDQYVFNKEQDFTAFNVETGQMLAGLHNLNGTEIPLKGYLATFVYRASADAVGTFVVDVLEEGDEANQTYLVGPYDGKISVMRIDPAVITIRPTVQSVRR